MNKYRAKKTVLDGITFHSKREANYYAELKLREKADEIYHIQLQPSWDIYVRDKKICKVILDFAFNERTKPKPIRRFIDVKGFDTAISKLKRKMLEAQEGIKVEVIK